MADEKNATLPAALAVEEPAVGAADLSKNTDVEMKDALENKPKEAIEVSDAPKDPAEPTTNKSASREPVNAPDTSPPAVAEPALALASTPADNKTKATRRKSTVLGSVKKKLNKKGSKAKILHLDAKPGDYYFVKLKGYPTWPVIVCSEDMLPQQLLKTRPVSAAHVDGTYRHDFDDGAKRVADRTFPVMYLQTNEFGWVSNQDFHELDPTVIMATVSEKMRRDLQQAYALAAAQHNLAHYKGLLMKFEQEKEEQAIAKAAAVVAKKVKKSKSVGPGDEDISMHDATEDEGKVKSRKRKADDGQAPQRSDSVKKPKIKLTTPRTANGALARSGKEEAGRLITAKVKKGDDKHDNKEAPKQPAPLTPEERHVRKEKEVLFLRHKLQRGLLTHEHEPKKDEMTSMSEYLAKLEGFLDLEVSIIRKTKINKVLKAILKLESIPNEEKLEFKPRSQVMLDRWNKLLAVDAATNSPAANGVNGPDVAAAEPKTTEPPLTTNGVKKGDEVEPEGAKDTETAKADEKTVEVAKVEAEDKEEEVIEAEIAV